MASEMAELEAREKETREKSFDEWLSKPEIGILISMIPESEVKDILKILLKTSFNAGFTNGQVNGMLEVMSTVIRPGENK